MRSLARGLDVLEFIARRNGVSFTEIRTATDLSKAVVHRILAELVRCGFAWRGQDDHCYYAAPLIAATPTSSYANLLRSASSEPMKKLIEEVAWPSDLFARDHTRMIMIESNRSLSPFHLHGGRIGQSAPILLSSVGRATLSRLNQDDRTAIYRDLQKSGEWNCQISWLKRPIDEVIAEARKRGYAERELGFAGLTLERQAINSIAVAIEVRDVVLGALNIWWPVAADLEGIFASRYCVPLAKCANQINENLLRLKT